MPYEKSTPTSPEAHSGSTVQENLHALAALFPSVVRDGQVDVDALRQLCGEGVVKDDELFGLKWRGRAEALAAAIAPSLGTLRPCKEESKNWDTTQNLYIEGDNLEVLKLLRKSYAGKIKMIYIDPPYNTGKEFVYPDNYQDSIANYKQLTGQNGKFAANSEISGRFHTDWLNMIYPRLVLARELLRNDGLIFVSIDENEFANAKLLLNLVFGEGNCVTDVIWKNRYNAAKEKHIAKIHEYIYVYAKDKALIEEISIPSTEDYIKKYFKYTDKKYDVRGPFRLQPLEAGKSLDARPNLVYAIKAPDGKLIYPKRQWKWDQSHVLSALEEDELYFNKVGNDWTVSTKQYLRDKNGDYYGVKPFSIIDNIYTQKATKEITALLGSDKIFPFPKPTDLLIHLMDIANLREGDIVVDFFSGSCTTAHALFRYCSTRQMVRFIMVQLPEPCNETSEAYKAGYKNICEIGKERIRRAGNQVKEEAGIAGEGLDIGFRVYKLDSSNVKAWNPQPEDLVDAMESYGEHLISGRTKDDFLTEILLKSGIDLTEKIETRDIAGHIVHSLGFGQYYACMDSDLAARHEEVALGIAAWHEEEVAASGGEQQDTCCVFVLDKAFTMNDAAKLNFVAILEQHGICNIKAL